MENLNIFECLYDDYKITKPIRLIELFSGYGSQALALKYLGANFSHWIICEWAMNSIIAYASVHRNELKDYGVDYSKELDKETIVGMLKNYGVSLDYNQPATLEQLKRVKEEKLRLCLNSIIWSHNLVDISRVKGKDLVIEDIENFTYLLTYSFPCQDLSLAGKGAGMEKGSGTRSGLLWEVERILSECKNKPQILLMENVPQVHGVGNSEHFKKWLLRLEEMGYQSYWDDLTAVDYGIPQTRNRTFMVSILGNYNYFFPKKMPLKLRLKDMLENEVDEKFYLSQKMIDYVTGVNQKDSKFPRGERFKQQLKLTNEKNIAVTISTNAGNRPVDNFIVDNNDDIKVIDSYNKKLTDSNLSGTISTRQGSNQGSMIIESIKIKNATKKGFLDANEGDGVDISSRMETHRGTVQKDKAQTITTMGGENVGVVVKGNTPSNFVGTYQFSKSDNFMQGKDRLKIDKDISDTILTSPKEAVVLKENDSNKVIKIGNYSPSNHNASSIVDTGGVAPTVMENHGTITAIVENDKDGKQ